jgi:rod shape-determining protein MreB
MSDKNDDLYVGIDLGTSRSSIASSSGERHVVDSYVGWPKDMVARKVLKRDLLIGREALENRSMLDLHRPLERGLIKEGAEGDAKAVRELLRHLLSLVGVNDDSRKERKVRAVVGVPAEALRVNKQHLREAMAGMVDSLIIVSEPFAVAYGIDELLHSLIIDIGAGTTDLVVMSGRYPTHEDQKTLTNAGDFVDDQLMKMIGEHHPGGNFTIHMVRDWKEEHSFVGKGNGRVKVEMPVSGKPTEVDITEEMRTACESIVPPVSEAMQDLIVKVEPEFQSRVRQNVILSGGTAMIKGLGALLQMHLGEIGGGRVRVVKDPVFVGADGGLAIAKDAPDSDWEKLSG